VPCGAWALVSRQPGDVKFKVLNGKLQVSCTNLGGMRNASHTLATLCVFPRGPVGTPQKFNFLKCRLEAVELFPLKYTDCNFCNAVKTTSENGRKWFKPSDPTTSSKCAPKSTKDVRVTYLNCKSDPPEFPGFCDRERKSPWKYGTSFLEIFRSVTWQELSTSADYGDTL